MRKYQLLAAFAFVTFVSTSSAGEKVDLSLPVKTNSMITIENMRGEVEIVGWDKPEVTISGELDDKAKSLIFRNNGNHVKIIVVMPEVKGRHRWKGHGSELVIHVPKKSSVKYDGIKAVIRLTDINNGINIKNISGSIYADNIGKRIRINSISGNITTSNLTGKIAFQTISGNINDNNSKGRLDFNTVSGNVNSESKATEVQISTVSGHVDLLLGEVEEIELSTVSGKLETEMELIAGGEARMSSTSGTISLELQNDVDAVFNLSSNTTRRISNRLTNNKAVEAKYGSGSKLSFMTGDGSASISISTMSGRITIRD